MSDINISALPSSISELTPGTYRHYKGNLYHVYGTATHSETSETLVVYRPLYGEGKLWVRPLGMFTELIVLDGESLPRFVRVNS